MEKTKHYLKLSPFGVANEARQFIELENRVVSYVLRVSKKTKRVRLAVYHGGNFVVTVPPFVGESFIKEILFKKVRWIIEKIEQAVSNGLTRHDSAESKFTPLKSYAVSRLHYEAHREEALKFAKERVLYWNQFYGFPHQKISVKNQKTRWGSCSKKGNLSFNYKIAFLPPALSDYIIVHELCHLKAFNHSQNFWSLVAQIIPQHKAIRKELKQMSLRSIF